MHTSSVATERSSLEQSSVEPSPEQTTGMPIRVAVIVGSIRADRFCPTVANWIADRARKHDDLRVDMVDLADYDCPAVLGGDDPDAPLPEQVAKLGERLAVADAFVVVTPVYNRSYPASLKNAIDWLYTEWQLKPVGLVSYGGITGGLQALDALRGVFTEFHSVTLRDSIAIANFWETFDHDGRAVHTERMATLASGFLDQLAWWARTLRDARAQRPYPFAISE